LAKIQIPNKKAAGHIRVIEKLDIEIYLGSGIWFWGFAYRRTIKFTASISS
jgi:hypothetical protein